MLQICTYILFILNAIISFLCYIYWTIKLYTENLFKYDISEKRRISSNGIKMCISHLKVISCEVICETFAENDMLQMFIVMSLLK